MGYNYIPGTPNYNAAVHAPREALTIGLDYYTITTMINIMPQPVGAFADVVGITAVSPSPNAFMNQANAANVTTFVPGTIPNDFSQDALDRLIEIVSQRGQPVIMGAPVAVVNSVTTFKFAIEHPSSWGVTANSSQQYVPMLANAIQTGGIDFGFGTGPDVPIGNAVTGVTTGGLWVTVSNSF